MGSTTPTRSAGDKTIRKGRHGGPSPTEKSSNTAIRDRPSVCAGQHSRGETRHTTNRKGQTDRQTEKNAWMDAAKRHSQSTWPVSMRPLHAGTQEKMVTREKSKKQHKHTEETNDRREKHRQDPHPGRQLHTSPHRQTPSQCRQSAGERIRPSTQQTHTPPAATRHGRGEETKRHHRLQFNPTAKGIRPQPRSQHTRS
ncbi:hypothetical protein TcCL_Unassigned00325 [Trypanosoma cruzi]|nr:hypothetical protein TcCL_Unassigned00325 [Trypanosoma cruzi]